MSGEYLESLQRDIWEVSGVSKGYLGSIGGSPLGELGGLQTVYGGDLGFIKSKYSEYDKIICALGRKVRRHGIRKGERYSSIAIYD